MNKSSKNYRENPNANAKIAFIIFYPFQFYVYKNVYKHLAQEAEFIIDSGRFYIQSQPKEVIESCANLLLREGVYFRVLYHEHYFDNNFLKKFFRQYDVLVSLWWSGLIDLPVNKNIKKVHLNYGAGKELSMFAPHHRKWDLYLCLNSRIYEVIKLFTSAKIVGYPKFDDWFDRSVEIGGEATKFVSDNRKKLDPGKKTLLYLPTHGDLSSIDSLSYELKKISTRYNIIVKLHYYTAYIEPDRKNLLQHPGFIVLNDEVDLLPLLKIADLVISDNSSAIFDAILADKPIIATNFLEKDFLDNTHKKTKLYPFRPIEGGLTYSQSIEQQVKNANLIISFSKPSGLESAVEEGLADTFNMKKHREKLRKELFAFNDGKCGKRAAKAINDLRYQSISPEKPILFHVFENYDISSEYMRNITPSVNFPNRDYIYKKTGRGRRTLMKLGSHMIEIKSLSFFERLMAIIREFF